MNLNLRTLEMLRQQSGKWRQSRCVLEKKGKQGDATGELLTKERGEIFIVFVQRAKWKFDVPLA